MSSFFSINSPLWKFSNFIVRCIWLNLLWFLCCIPVITIGASTTALYSVSLKCVKNQEGYITREFFQAFRKNFVPATIVWCILAVIGIFLGIDLILYLRTYSVSFSELFFMIIFLSGLLIFIFVNFYVYALIATFQNTTWAYLKNAFVISICNWPKSIFMVIITVITFFISMLFFPPLLFINAAGLCYLYSKSLNKIFSHLV